MKKILLGFLFFFLIVFVASIAIAGLFEKQISKQLITAINKELVADIQVEDFDLSLLRGFPFVSAQLNKVQVPDNRKGILLEAESMSFRIGLLSLLRSNLDIGSVVIENGALFVAIDRKGRANYLIAKETEETESSDFSLSLKEATLKNMELIYIDKRAQQETKMLLKNALFSGEFASDQFSLTSDADILSHFVEVEGERFLAGKELGYDATIYVDLKNELYEFQQVELQVEDNSFDVTGTIHQLKAATVFDLVVHTKDGNLESVIQLLPSEYAYLEGFSSRGNFNFDTIIKGKLSDRENPEVSLKFGLEDGSIQHNDLGSSIKDVSFAANFKSGESGSGNDAVFEINNFKGYFNRELIESKLKVTNLKNPRIQLDLDGTLPLESLYPLLNMEAITGGDGEVELRKIHIDGYYDDMIQTSRVHKVNTSGVIELDDAALTINKENIIFDKGVFTMKDNQLRVWDVEMEGAGSELLFNGHFTNFLPVLLADSINSKDAQLKFEAILKAETLDIDRLLTLSALKLEEDLEDLVPKGAIDSLKEAKTEQREFIVNFLNGAFEADIASFNYNKVEGENFTGKLEFADKEMSIVGELGAMGGSIDIDGTGYFQDRTKLDVKVVCNDIDATEFFRQLEDFGQEVLSYKHIKGTLSTKMAIDALWDKEANFLYDDLKVLAEVSATDGELNNFGMLEEFSSYVKVKDLKNIRFVDMQNWFEIDKQKLYIPVMLIQNNAMNMLLSGNHNFENEFEYNMKINVAQVLFDKFKKHDRDLDPKKVKVNGRSWFNMHFNVDGDFDDYDVKTNKRQVNDAFKLSEYRKNGIQARLNKKFGKSYRMEIPKAYESKFKDLKDLDKFDEGKIMYLDPIVGRR